MRRLLLSNYTWYASSCLLLFAVASLILFARASKHQACQYVDADSSRCFRIETVSTAQAKEVGLGGRASLASDQAMLFVFEQDSLHGFWMRDMHFSIDIVWLDSQKQIVHIEKSAAPDSYPTVFSPTTPARYVLEVIAGTTEQLNWHIGTVLQF